MRVIDDKSDARLLREFRKGDMDAFEILVRRQQQINPLPLDQPLPTANGGGMESDILEKNHLEQLIRGLPARQQEVTVLHIYEGFTLAEVSVALGIPLGTVKSNYHKALVNLRRGYADDQREH